MTNFLDNPSNAIDLIYEEKDQDNLRLLEILSQESDNNKYIINNAKIESKHHQNLSKIKPQK